RGSSCRGATAWTCGIALPFLHRVDRHRWEIDLTRPVQCAGATADPGDEFDELAQHEPGNDGDEGNEGSVVTPQISTTLLPQELIRQDVVIAYAVSPALDTALAR